MKAEVDAVVARQQARVAEWEAAVSEEESALAAKHNSLQVQGHCSTQLQNDTVISAVIILLMTACFCLLQAKLVIGFSHEAWYAPLMFQTLLACCMVQLLFDTHHILQNPSMCMQIMAGSLLVLLVLTCRSKSSRSGSVRQL